MGNNPSKPDGAKPASPVVTHSSSSSTNHSRKEQKSSTAQPSVRTAPVQHTSHPAAHLQHHSDSANSSPTQHHSQGERMGNEQSHSKWKDRKKKEQSTPVKVPRGAEPRRQKGPDSRFEPSGPPRDPSYIPHSNLNFPPRLPLPIEEEVHTPGSPIITPADLSSALHYEDVEGALPRQVSIVSNTTIDDDELGDELQPYPFEGSKRTVPTLVQWKQGGDKVYVTGTFTSWSRKFRMTRDPETNILSNVLQLPPGTHHVKFIVDGEMQLSNELPTAVDYTNILVNYIEVSADDLPKDSETEIKVHPPQVLPKGTEATDHDPNSVGKTQSIETPDPVYWGDDVPKYLHDLDLSEQARRYQRAARGVAEFATPPSLPLFLGKSILNGSTPMKDDSSVLNMPNHTVLNHLATSSIKNQVLATSVTTRYKRKYVTTIMYKPTVDETD